MGLRLFFLTNFPGAMFIQGATFIPDSRVGGLVPGKNCVTKNTCQCDCCCKSTKIKPSSYLSIS